MEVEVPVYEDLLTMEIQQLKRMHQEYKLSLERQGEILETLRRQSDMISFSLSRW